MNGIVARPGCANGASKMPGIIASAPGDIAGRLWTLYWLVRMTDQNLYIVELGTRQGDSTRALLAACIDIGEKKLVSHDVEDCQGAISDPDMLNYWAFYQLDSVKAGHLWKPPVDMIFIDTDHTLATTRAEISAWHPHVRVGGCMVFHDYWLNREPEGQGVKIAVDEFFGQRQEDWMLECHDAANDTGLGILWHIK